MDTPSTTPHRPPSVADGTVDPQLVLRLRRDGDDYGPAGVAHVAAELAGGWFTVDEPIAALPLCVELPAAGFDRWPHQPAPPPLVLDGGALDLERLHRDLVAAARPGWRDRLWSWRQLLAGAVNRWRS